ncbi:MAG: hypothetical protein KatS3mg031_1726 [Chitinophagales bacterium]|nr:MAG: hypothetical protein KatS3mg031_1726 [Chitinophagales bacterium]
MSKIIKEPLLHFFLIGAGLFGVYHILNPRQGPPGEITVSAQKIAELAAIWQMQWNRPPTEEELDEIIRNFLQEEILYREALELGLDQNDILVRRRLAQKLQFILEDKIEIKDPTDEELKAFYDANRDNYKEPTRLTFQQVAVLHQPGAERKATEILRALRQQPWDSPHILGVNRTAVPEKWELSTREEIERVFGSGFSDKLLTADLNTWIGPLSSGLGFHLIKVEEIQRDAWLPFETIRSRVEADWREYQKTQAWNAQIQRMASRYSIRIEKEEWLKSCSGEK